MRYFVRMAARLSVILLCVQIAAGSAQAKRVALVIGNASYRVGALQNPVNDATAVAEALASRLRFEKVVLRTNIGAEAFRAALGAFRQEAVGADVAVVYFAGHGIEIGGRNFLIPVDATLAEAGDADLQAIALDTVLKQLAGARKLKLVILDACRNNPFAGVRRSSGRGLSRIEPEDNTLVAYAARDGTTAEDGPAHAHSPFTTALLKHIATPGVDVRFLFARVRNDVLELTDRGQQPHLYGTLGPDQLYLMPPVSVAGVDPGKQSKPPGESADGMDAKAIAEAAKARAEAEIARAEAARLRSRTDMERAKAEAERAAAELARARAEAELARAQAEAALAEAERARAQAEKERARTRAEKERQLIVSPPPVAEMATWNHNGSTMRLVAEGDVRRFHYESPREGLLREGVAPGTLLFEGTRHGDVYSGTAYVFSRKCGSRSYSVSGTASNDARIVTMTGQAPRLNTACEVIGYRLDTLVFHSLGP